MLAAAQPVPPAASAPPAAHTPMSMTDQWQGGGYSLLHPIHFNNYRYSGPGRGGGWHVGGQLVVVDGVEHPEEGVEAAGHWEMCATTSVSLDIGHAPAPPGSNSRE
ncbi:hypothetical protein ATANTOWER_030382 [Ataeniobius toweri]|uniref:Uncharacterized protein n=1 Tax=Ataeniobius toweri TaxID=208326 RepID=A0ABU7BBT1_9TELE|nr:hypothetical protein [Ataeniobius toweri]